MDKIIIEGGRKLRGVVETSGAKNAALPILIATLLTDEKCVINNVPDLQDIRTTIMLLGFFGKDVIRHKKSLIITRKDNFKFNLRAPYDLIRKMRASFLVSGALLARYGKGEVSQPGGCAIGVRPVDIHLDGFKRLGAQIEFKEGYILMHADRFEGNVIPLRMQSVGATENLLLASVFAHGKTVIKNAACEPEVVDLANFLNSLGANIRDAGRKTIEITGVKKLHGTCGYDIIPDRIEAGTYLIAGAVCGGNVTVKKCLPSHLEAVIQKLRKAAFRVSCTENSITINSASKIKPVSIVTTSYPGFPTDLQAQWMTLMCMANGRSYIRETIFENRFMHVAELQRLGAKLNIRNDTVTVGGSRKLMGAPVMVSDLRAGSALVIAGLAAKGKTTINRVYHLDRGYECIEKKLRKLGARIYRQKDK